MSSSSIVKKLSRRTFLRGTLQGTGIVVGLPVLDCLLNENGTAAAAELGGRGLPTVFGTWFWPHGLSPGQWEPDSAGRNFTFGRELATLSPIQDKINLFSGMQVFLDGTVHEPHTTAGRVIATGEARGKDAGYGVSLDEVVATGLDVRTRFRTITVACDGDRASTFSTRDTHTLNPAEISPLALYGRLFQEGFVDPNTTEFEVDPMVLARRSVLSAVKEDRRGLMKLVGARDKERLDSLFTSMRELEQRLAIELQEPEPLPACRVPSAPEGEHPSSVIGDVMQSHRFFVELLSYAVACGQTRIFNVSFSRETSSLRRPGATTAHHTYTHEEPIDPELGYQPHVSWFASQAMKAFYEMVTTFDSYREGEKTLLDRSLIVAFTEHGEARLHSLKNYMMLTAGAANGNLSTGWHIDARGEPSTRVGLTCQHAMDLRASSWAQGSNKVTEPFAEVLVGGSGAQATPT